MIMMSLYWIILLCITTIIVFVMDGPTLALFNDNHLHGQILSTRLSQLRSHTLNSEYII